MTDIVEEKLESAKKMGADVLVNGKTQNLPEVGKKQYFQSVMFLCYNTLITHTMSNISKIIPFKICSMS